MDKTLTEQEIALLRRKLDLLLRTGQLLVESAADTNRVVRNLNRVAAYLGLSRRCWKCWKRSCLPIRVGATHFSIWLQSVDRRFRQISLT